jgi:hypothetical protein
MGRRELESIASVVSQLRPGASTTFPARSFAELGDDAVEQILQLVPDRESVSVFRDQRARVVRFTRLDHPVEDQRPFWL